jgi:hypothetical protein
MQAGRVAAAWTESLESLGRGVSNITAMTEFFEYSIFFMISRCIFIIKEERINAK